MLLAVSLVDVKTLLLDNISKTVTNPLQLVV